ncbi:MAG: hypothetical protein AAF960_29820, partial [Bacteroidota bacterium]
MAYSTTITPEAYADINDASEWYDQQVSELGLDFVLEFLEETNYISENSQLFPYIAKPVRRKLQNRYVVAPGTTTTLPEADIDWGVEEPIGGVETLLICSTTPFLQA